MNSTCSQQFNRPSNVGKWVDPPSTTLGRKKKGRRGNGVGKNGGLEGGGGVGGMEEAKMDEKLLIGKHKSQTCNLTHKKMDDM